MNTVIEEIGAELASREMQQSADRRIKSNELRNLIVAIVTGKSSINSHRVLALCEDLELSKAWFDQALANCAARAAGMDAVKEMENLSAEWTEVNQQITDHAPAIGELESRVRSTWTALRELSGAAQAFPIKIDVTAEELQAARLLESELHSLRDDQYLRKCRAYRNELRRRELRDIIAAGERVHNIACGLDGPADFVWP